MTSNKKIAVLGGGSWATAIVKLLLNNVDTISWYVRHASQIEHIKEFRRNPTYLSSVELHTEKLVLSNDIEEIINSNDILIFAIPAPFIRPSLENKNIDFANKFVVSAAKGIVPDCNLTVAEFFNENYNIPFDSIGILSGPCHAEEIALEKLSYLTVASTSKEQAGELASSIQCQYLKTNIAKDIYGIEYAAVLKNIFSIAAGICHGLGYGDNFQAVLISNAHREMKRFLEKTYPSKRKTSSSPYLGDLLVTAYSQFSRNRMFGNMIGKGYSVNSAHLEMNMIAEGYYAVKCIKEINEKHGVLMPITDSVYRILYEKMAPSIEIKLLTENLK